MAPQFDIKVRGFAGCGRADLSVSGLALIAGRNKQGKTSTLQAIACALTGDFKTRGIHLKGAAKDLVRDGQEGAVVTITVAGADKKAKGSFIRMRWPAVERETEGAPVAGMPLAVGSAVLTECDLKTRAMVLTDLLKADPSEDDLRQALKDAGISEKNAKTLVDRVATQGWDPALEITARKGMELKANWKTVAGENWGSNKADGWKPKGWDIDPDRPKDIEGAEEAVAIERANHTDMVRRAGMTSGVIEEKERQLAEATATSGTLAEHEEDLKKAEADLAEATAERAKIRNPDAEHALPCPHCGQGINLVRENAAITRLEKVLPENALSDERVEYLRRSIATWDGKIANVKGRVQDANMGILAARNAGLQAKKLEGEIAEAKRTTGASKNEVEQAAAAVKAAEDHRDNLRRYLEASGINRMIGINLAAQGVLKPEGLRQAKLAEALKTLNAEMQAFDQLIASEPVAITGDMEVLYGVRPYGLCSESEKWRARLSIQVALARRGHAGLMIVDALDVIEVPARSAIVQGLAETGIPTVIAMTAASPKAGVPDLEKAGLGATWWIEGGETEPLADAIAAMEGKKAA